MGRPQNGRQKNQGKQQEYSKRIRHLAYLLKIKSLRGGNLVAAAVQLRLIRVKLIKAMTFHLFEQNDSSPQNEEIAPGAVFLHRFALPHEAAILQALSEITASAPFRHMVTPGGHQMSVAMTNCGLLGWISDKSGYRYSPADPQTGKNWPRMPEVFLRLATTAASEAGFAGFAPDACLINRYHPGTKLSLHQDKDERDFSHPIVSVSLGIPAVFLFGGLKRTGKTQRLPVQHGDVIVWGGPARLRFHGIMPLKPAIHPALGSFRVNLTFRKAG
jgi:alkylated DNA repair protein (DNA oxidative demethylase)